MSSRTKHNYEKIRELPRSALSVTNFAEEQDVTVPYIYRLHSRNKLSEMGKKIVDFQGYLFVIPITKKKT
jgi:hypothetical protein